MEPAPDSSKSLEDAPLEEHACESELSSDCDIGCAGTVVAAAHSVSGFLKWVPLILAESQKDSDPAFGTSGYFVETACAALQPIAAHLKKVRRLLSFKHNVIH